VFLGDFDSDLNRSGDINVSGTGSHIAISGCRSLSQALADIFFELSVVVNHRLTVEISMLSVVVSDT